MENSYDFNAPKIDLPNSTVVLALGIISIVTCCCGGFIGLICAIIALVLSKSATDLYVSDPGRFTENSYKNLNTGKICAWIGLALSVIMIIRLIWVFSVIGFDGLSDPSLIYERLERLGIHRP